MATLALGTLLAGRYRLTAVLGEGGAGVVYEARDERIGRIVAVKTLHPRVGDAEDRETDLRRFAQEIEVVSRLRSPHIVQILDSLPDDGAEGPSFVMERLEGEPLRALLAREGKLPVERAVHVARQLLEALACAHEAGVVHRDVKPENVFIAKAALPDFVKLLDFGVTKRTELAEGDVSITGSPVLVGTIAYAAPEQVRAERVTPAVDVYAVGTCLFEMLVGRRPHEGSSGEILSAKLCDRSPRSIREVAPDVPLAVARAVEAMLRPAGARPRDARAALAALEGAASEGRVPLTVTAPPTDTVAPPLAPTPTPPSPATQAVPEAPRSWAVPALAFAALALLAIVVGGGAALLSTTQPRPPALPAEGGASADASPPRGDVSPDEAARLAPSSDAAAAVVGSVEGGAADGGAAGVRAPPSCRCVEFVGVELCLEPMPPICTCNPPDRRGLNLCPEAVLPGEEPAALSGSCKETWAWRGPELRDGDPCSGWEVVQIPTDAGWRGKNQKTAGVLECSRCTAGGRRAPQKGYGVHGAPCRGFDGHGAPQEGTWRCR